MRHRTQAVYVISVAAELAGMHPQTLRIYERRGLVLPGPHTGRQPAVQRRRHRDAAPHHRAGRSGHEPRGHPPRDGSSRPRTTRLRAELARAAIDGAPSADAEAEARQRRDLVPLRQAVAVFGERPGFLRDDR